VASLPIPDPKDLANFGWLEPWAGRGAEPTPAGFKWLRDFQFTTVVNLREEDNTEALLATDLGLKHQYIPVRDNQAPIDAQTFDWLNLCADVTARPLFVHCQSGHGRTSTFCILLRLAQGWKLEDAIDEQAKRYGFKPEHDVAQTAYLHDVRRRMKAGELVLPDIP
jgi:protein tyrosine/serine phosphatase